MSYDIWKTTEPDPHAWSERCPDCHMPLSECECYRCHDCGELIAGGDYCDYCRIDHEDEEAGYDVP